MVSATESQPPPGAPVHHPQARWPSDPRTGTERSLDALTEVLLGALVIGGPWLFGSVHAPVIWSMTAVGWTLGFIALIRLALGRAQRARARAGRSHRTASPHGAQPRPSLAQTATRCLALLTVLIPGYILIAALNPRARYQDSGFRLDDLAHVTWLPSTYDAVATWFLFWQYLGIAAAFWATRQWLLQDPGRQEAEGVAGLPPRLRRLVVVWSLSGALLGTEAMAQRALGSDLLLFFFEPNYPGVDRIYGPFGYRSNAAQYLNLVWPMAAGAAWVQARRRRPRRQGAGLTPWLLAACSGVMAVASLTSLSRGGVLVAVAQLLALTVLLTLASGAERTTARLGYAFLAIIALQIGLILGWQKLAPRLATAFSDRLSGRLDIYAAAEPIARDHRWFGTGPGTFPLVYGFYRPKEQVFWAPQAHNDWLETRVTFGWVGMALVVMILPLIPMSCLTAGGLQVHWLMPASLILALGGALLHARFDYPFQVHSILACFALQSAALVSLSRETTQASPGAKSTRQRQDYRRSSRRHASALDEPTSTSSQP